MSDSDHLSPPTSFTEPFKEAIEVSNALSNICTCGDPTCDFDFQAGFAAAPDGYEGDLLALPFGGDIMTLLEDLLGITIADAPGDDATYRAQIEAERERLREDYLAAVAGLALVVILGLDSEAGRALLDVHGMAVSACFTDAFNLGLPESWAANVLEETDAPNELKLIVRAVLMDGLTNGGFKPENHFPEQRDRIIALFEDAPRKDVIRNGYAPNRVGGPFGQDIEDFEDRCDDPTCCPPPASTDSLKEAMAVFGSNADGPCGDPTCFCVGW